MWSTRNTRQRGFTLIELVVVIVILGILAAFAIPRFANIARDARISALNGMAGTLRSSAALVHGMALARNVINDAGVMPGAPVQLEGNGIAVVNAYPAATANGIIAAMVSPPDPSTYTVAFAAGPPASVTISMVGASTPANCQVTYTEAGVGGAAAVNVPATAILQANC